MTTFSELTEYFKADFSSNIANSENLLNRLKQCNNDDDIANVSREQHYSLYPAEELLLCEGFVCGNASLKNNILSFLNDINFHYESTELVNNLEEYCLNTAEKIQAL